MDEADLIEAVTSTWVAHGIMSFKETHAHIGESCVDLSAVKKACSKAKKAGAVFNAREAHLSEVARKCASDAAITRFETSERSRQPARSTEKQANNSIFSTDLSWTAGD